MYIAIDPVLKFSDLWSQTKPNKNNKKDFFAHEHDAVFFYSHGRQAIADAITVLGIRPGEKVLMPAYICDVAVTPFIKKSSSNMRYNVRRRIRQLRKFGFEVEIVNESDKFCSAFEETVRLHNLRWQADSLPGNFTDYRVLKFHKMLLPLSNKTWKPIFFFLADSNKSIAALYGFQYKDKFLYYQGGYDPAFTKYSPGMALMALVIEYTIKEHLNEFDFLRGNEPYKWKWTHEYRRTVGYSVFQRKIKCGIQAILDHGFQELKRQLKKPGDMMPIFDSPNKQNSGHRSGRNNGRVLRKQKHSIHI